MKTNGLCAQSQHLTAPKHKADEEAERLKLSKHVLLPFEITNTHHDDLKLKSFCFPSEFKRSGRWALIATFPVPASFSPAQLCPNPCNLFNDAIRAGRTVRLTVIESYHF